MKPTKLEALILAKTRRVVVSGEPPSLDQELARQSQWLRQFQPALSWQANTGAMWQRDGYNRRTFTSRRSGRLSCAAGQGGAPV